MTEKRFTVILTKEIHQAAKLKALKEGTTLSDLIRSWLFSWLANDQPKAEVKTPTR